MKFRLDKVGFGKAQWQLIADTRRPNAWVLDGQHVYEFANRHEATQFLVAEYRRQADLRNMQPGQNYSLTMADGSTKMVQVQNQTPDGVTVLDSNSGQSMVIPHVQPGAEPKPATPSQPKMPGQGGAATPPPNNGASPENVTAFALGLNDLRVTASEYGRTPNNCKHDGSHLNRKNPSDPEKFCPDCGMVYAASVKRATITGGPGSYHVKSEEGKNLGGPYKTREQAEHRLKQVEYFKHKGSNKKEDLSKEEMDAQVKLTDEIVDELIEEEKAEKGKKAKIISQHKECVNCGGHGNLNESGECPKCARRKAFRTWKNRDRMVRAYDLLKQADAPFPGQQGMPAGDVANEGQTIMRDEKGPADFAEEPESQPQGDPNAKRKLTPHEIIEEAESLIRNALVKGVRIGASELSEYMTTYYNNPPDELMQGIALAWQKVQYEEQMEGGPGKPDPNAPQGEGFGPKAPTTPEEAQQMAPKNGPIRTREF